MRKLSTAFLIAGVAAMVALAGCGGGGGGGGTTPNPPPSGNLIITGKVVNYATGNGVQGVIIRFGNALVSTTTRSDGSFSLDIGTTSVLLAYSGALMPFYFTVSTEALPQPPVLPGHNWGDYYPATSLVEYKFYPSVQGTFWQNAVPVPQEVINGSTTSLGTIKVFDADTVPPPPS